MAREYLTPQAKDWDQRSNALYRRAQELIKLGDEALACKVITEARGCSKLAVAWEQAAGTRELARLKALLEDRDAAEEAAVKLQ